MLMGTLLAQTGMDEGKHVTWFPSYGPAMRGGTANCSVVVSDHEIASPIISHPEVLAALNEESFKRFEPDVKKNGMILYNQSLVSSRPRRKDCTYFPVAATEEADALGTIKIANMVMLGALVKATGVVKLRTAKESLKQTLPAAKHKLLDINTAALEKGSTLTSP
jgi:2-oxoglutarate ferredoxin oxidoreductase subunit gamma